MPRQSSEEDLKLKEEAFPLQRPPVESDRKQAPEVVGEVDAHERTLHFEELKSWRVLKDYVTFACFFVFQQLFPRAPNPDLSLTYRSQHTQTEA